MAAYYVAEYLCLADVVARFDAQPHCAVSQQATATTDYTVQQDGADL